MRTTLPLCVNRIVYDQHMELFLIDIGPSMRETFEGALAYALAQARLSPGTDVRKYGKQWVVTRSAMVRELWALENTPL